MNQEIRTRVQQAVAQIPKPWIAAFDADGTLWDTDVGESFFEYQIQNSGLKLPPNPWAEYLDKKAIHPPTAYLWLAQINQGQRVETVRAWAEKCYLSEEPFPFFPAQKSLIQFLIGLGVKVYVVSASVKWSVEPAARRLGIPPEQVLGVATTEESLILTKERSGPITWKEGKVEALYEATGGVRPILVSGNTTGDLPLMETATSVQIAVSSRNSIVPEAEAQLKEIALKRNWFYHQF